MSFAGTASDSERVSHHFGSHESHGTNSLTSDRFGSCATHGRSKTIRCCFVCANRLKNGFASCPMMSACVSCLMSESASCLYREYVCAIHCCSASGNALRSVFEALGDGSHLGGSGAGVRAQRE